MRSNAAPSVRMRANGREYLLNRRQQAIGRKAEQREMRDPLTRTGAAVDPQSGDDESCGGYAFEHVAGTGRVAATLRVRGRDGIGLAGHLRRHFIVRAEDGDVLDRFETFRNDFSAHAPKLRRHDAIADQAPPYDRVYDGIARTEQQEPRRARRPD